MRPRLLLVVAMLWSCAGWAATDDDTLEREMNIMREILRTASESRGDDRPVRIRSVHAHYLAGQGVLFRTALRDFDMRFWRNGDVNVAGIPDFVQDIIVDVRASVPYIDSEALEALRELREEQRGLREEQRDTRRELRELSRRRDKAAARDADTDDIEKKIEELETALEVLENQYDEVAAEIELEHKRFREERADRYEQRRLDRQQAYTQLEDLLLQTLCDYGQTLKSLPSEEHVNLLIEDAELENGDEFDRMFVFRKKDVLACQGQSIDVAELRERATIYDQ